MAQGGENVNKQTWTNRPPIRNCEVSSNKIICMIWSPHESPSTPTYMTCLYTSFYEFFA